MIFIVLFLGVPVDFDKTKSRHSRMEYQPFVGQNLKVFKENGGFEPPRAFDT